MGIFVRIQGESAAESKTKLTDEQKKYLAETYERTDMTEEEYHAFAKDLYEFGILDRLLMGIFVRIQGESAAESKTTFLSIGSPCKVEITGSEPLYYEDFRLSPCILRR